MAGRPGAPGAARHMGRGRRARWGHSWAPGPSGSCPPLPKGLGPEKMPRSFSADYRDFLTTESRAGTGLRGRCLTPVSDPSLTNTL